MFNFHRRRIQQNNQHTPWHELWRQPLAAMIRMPWWLFFATMVAIYLSQIIIFGLILSLDVQHIVGDAPMGIPKPFAFAIESFLGNAFSGLEPNSRFTYAIAVLDLISGLITVSTLTAVVFSRLSSNETPLIFSRHLCISSLNNGHLFCRFVTTDRSQWLNVSYTLSLIFDDELEPSLWQRRIVPLATLNAGTPQLSQTATLTHNLDADSPITQIGLEGLLQRNAVVMPLVEGIDETTGSGLVQTHLYSVKDIMLGYRYGDLVSSDNKGRRRIDIQRLNNIVAYDATS
jgi:inward rectifier potassium channel